MRVQSITIHNLRSFHHQTIQCESFVVLIGPNNAGKSTVLLALEHFFKPGHKLQEDDIFRHRAIEDRTAYVEICFFELTEQDKITFQKYLLSDGKIRIRKETTIDPNGFQGAYHGYIQKAPYDWLDPDKAGDYKKAEDLPEELKPYIKDSGKLSKSKVEEAQKAYITANRGLLSFKDTIEIGPLMGQKNVAAGLLGEFFLLPAVRDYTDEAKIQEKTTFGQLVTAAVQEMSERNPEYQRVKDQLIALMDELNKPKTVETRGRPSELVQLEENIQRELGQWSVTLDIEVSAPEIEKLFQLGTKIFVDDGVRTTPEMKGHGLQRAMVFAFLKAWTRTIKALKLKEGLGEGEAKPRAPTQTYIFGIEEPELFLHPHAQRGMFAVLKALADEVGHQVFICTHSSYFVEMDLYRSIVIINKNSPKEGSVCLQATKELFEGEKQIERKRKFNMCYWFNTDRSELFFARKVILVEGPTEKSILPMLAKRLGFWKADVTVIDCGGKGSIPLYIEVLNAFKIHYIVIHDEDPVTLDITDKNYNHQKEMFSKNEEIQGLIDRSLGETGMLSPDFEGVSGITKAQVDKCGKPMAALNRFSDEAAEIPQRLKEVTKEIYRI